MNKNEFAKTPPMGWNSYDYYDTTVTEEDIKKNADYMATHLKPYGWEYVVVDIEWYAYDVATQRDEHQYIPFYKVEMDEYGRLLPCPQRFPSAVGGQGFKPLADYIHERGLKFGIHIMRGIPREAAHQHLPVLNSHQGAHEIAEANNICFWNPDMYGLNPKKEGAQAYYDSLFKLYADWGVDFIKCDDICRMDMPTAKAEIEMMHLAIQKTGREIVFSLSPGPAKIEEAWHYEKYANMWRITDDFWDHWPLLLNMFERCELWQNHVSEGCYPDCDMLPLGYVGKGFNHERMTLFTQDEQITMMTLWCLFRSPMMLGAELTKLDDWTLKLLTNEKVLHLLSGSKGARQVMRNENQAVWATMSEDREYLYVALFNLRETTLKVSGGFDACLEILNETKWLGRQLEHFQIEELWTGDKIALCGNDISDEILAHGAKLYQLIPSEY